MKPCDNTDCESGKDVVSVTLTDEFDNDKCNWCKDCRERDANMIKKINY